MVHGTAIWVMLRAFACQAESPAAGAHRHFRSKYMPVTLEQPGELMVALLPRLRRLAHAIAAPAHAADDLVQQCIERALQSDAKWRSHRELENGMFGMLARACAAAGQSSAGVEVATAERVDTLDAVQLRRAYARLPLQQRVAIALVVLEERSYHDTAILLEIPLQTLTQQLWQGREALRLQLRA
jgi:RNA polymerase sigma-70 factor (ECF subfamily)